MDKKIKHQQDREYYQQHRQQILKRVSEYQKREKTRVNEYQRQYQARKRREDPEWKARRDAWWKAYYCRTRAKRLVYRASQYNTLKELARRLVRNALRKDELVRPSFCEACNKPCKPQMHHPDYQKPLEVIWLCSFCHGIIHSK